MFPTNVTGIKKVYVSYTMSTLNKPDKFRFNFMWNTGYNGPTWITIEFLRQPFMAAPCLYQK